MKAFDLTGKVAIVTGSSRGIGKSIASHLAEAGARVVISSRKQAACDAVAAEINARHGGTRAIAVTANISSKEALKALVDQAVSTFGRLDIVVCNAASNPYYGPMDGISDEQFRKILDNNILANHWLITFARPELIRQGGGSIIIVSSTERCGLTHTRRLLHLQGGRHPAGAQSRQSSSGRGTFASTASSRARQDGFRPRTLGGPGLTRRISQGRRR